MSYGNSKVDRIIDMCGELDERDFADLAVACADQAMLSVRDQDDLRHKLESALEEFERRQQRQAELRASEPNTNGYAPGDGTTGDRQ